MMTTRGVGKSKGVAFRHDEVPHLEGVMEDTEIRIPETEVQAGMLALRNILEVTGYSSYISDQQCREIVVKILEAALAVRAG